MSNHSGHAASDPADPPQHGRAASTPTRLGRRDLGADQPDHASPPPTILAALLLHSPDDGAASHHPVPFAPARPTSRENVLTRLERLYQLQTAVNEVVTELLHEPRLDQDPVVRRVLVGIAQRASEDHDLTRALLRVLGRRAVDHAATRQPPG